MENFRDGALFFPPLRIEKFGFGKSDRYIETLLVIKEKPRNFLDLKMLTDISGEPY